MATTKGDKLNWSDIQSIYTSLNTCQTKFGITKTAIPSNPGQCKPNVISNLKTAIGGLSSSSYVNSSFVSSVNNLTVPAAGTLIVPQPFDTMESALATIQGVCANDGFSPNFDCFCGFSVQGYSCFADPGCSSDFYCNAFF